MTTAAEDLRSKVLALPEADRKELAYLLFDSLEAEGSGEEDAAYLAELKQREADYLSGKTPAIPWDEALALVDAQLLAPANEAVGH